MLRNTLRIIWLNLHWGGVLIRLVGVLWMRLLWRLLSNCGGLAIGVKLRSIWTIMHRPLELRKSKVTFNNIIWIAIIICPPFSPSLTPSPKVHMAIWLYPATQYPLNQRWQNCVVRIPKVRRSHSQWRVYPWYLHPVTSTSRNRQIKTKSNPNSTILSRASANR